MGQYRPTMDTTLNIYSHDAAISMKTMDKVQKSTKRLQVEFRDTPRCMHYPISIVTIAALIFCDSGI